jgi:hypothetical protein
MLSKIMNRPDYNLRRFAYGSMGLLVWLAVGCGTPHPAHVKPKTDQSADASANLPGGITGTGWHIPWRTVDPKHPHGPPITVLIADAQNGSMASQDDDITVRLWQVHAQLFRDNRPAAIVDAAEITTDRRTKVVIGAGGVTIRSLPGAAKTARDHKNANGFPPNTTLTADKMTWDTQTSKLIALGHVHAIQRLPGNRLPTETTGERMEYNMETGDLSD